MAGGKARKLTKDSSPASEATRRSERLSGNEDEEDFQSLGPTKRKPTNTAIIALKSIGPSSCNQQKQSPLFGVLSPELRNMIFDLVLQPVVHSTTDYKVNAKMIYTGSCYYLTFRLMVWMELDRIRWGGRNDRRPQSRGSVDTALIRTCRLVYTETHNLMFLNAPLEVFCLPSLPGHWSGKYHLRYLISHY
jgi:hypothetical protein